MKNVTNTSDFFSSSRNFNNFMAYPCSYSLCILDTNGLNNNCRPSSISKQSILEIII